MMEDLKTIKERGGILTEDEMIVITDKVCANHRTTWEECIGKTSYENIVINMYLAVNREATKKILYILKNEDE